MYCRIEEQDLEEIKGFLLINNGLDVKEISYIQHAEYEEILDYLFCKPHGVIPCYYYARKNKKFFFSEEFKIWRKVSTCEHFYFIDNEFLKNFTGLLGMEILEFFHHHISKLEPLYGLKNLKKLILSPNKNITKEELERFEQEVPECLIISGDFPEFHQERRFQDVRNSFKDEEDNLKKKLSLYNPKSAFFPKVAIIESELDILIYSWEKDVRSKILEEFSYLLED